MKKVSTTVKTGDIITIGGKQVTIGLYKKIDGKNKIALHYKLSETAGITEWVTTQQLNKLLNNSGAKGN